MALTVFAVVVDSRDPRRQADFWAAALSQVVFERNPGEFRVSDSSGGGDSLYFMAVDEPKVGKNRLHVDLLTDGPLAAEVARLVAVGARLLDYRQDPDSFANPDTWAVLQDPEGNEFCVTSSETLSGWT